MVDTVKFKADTIRYESYYHSGNMKATSITEINSHPCNEYLIKNYKYQGLWNGTLSRPERSGYHTFSTTVKSKLTNTTSN